MTTTWTSPKTEPYPCDRGFGDGVGRGYHSFYGPTAATVCCTYCGKRPKYATGGYVGPYSASWIKESAGYIVPKEQLRRCGQ
jgi:hypothetical protein